MIRRLHRRCYRSRRAAAYRTPVPAPHHGQHASNRSRTPRKFVAHPPESRTSLQFGTPSRRGRPPLLLITGSMRQVEAGHLGSSSRIFSNPGPRFNSVHPLAEAARPCSSSRAACVKSKQDTSETPRASPQIPDLASIGTPSRRGRPPPLLITGREARLRGSYLKESECSLSITGRGTSQDG